MSEKAPPHFGPTGGNAGGYEAFLAPPQQEEAPRIDRREATHGFALRLVVFSVLLVSSYFASLPVMDLTNQLSLDLEHVVQKPAP